jgi:anti-sigma-K factor RskA
VNIQEYISGGIVESYVLGLLSAQERFEFEQICAAYPEVKAAREAFELSLEKQAMENAIAPPAYLKQKIFETIRPGGKIISMPAQETTPVKRIKPVTPGWLKIAAAACFILLAGSLWWNMSLKNENRKLKTDLNSSAERLAQLEADAKAMQRSGIKMARMDGTEKSPQSFATVYWDTTSHDVYLLINNMPKPASDQQYQLWALLDGQPIDMGIVEITEKPLQLYRMKNAQAAQAFAITLEKKGRSSAAAPEGDIHVLGKL